MNRRVLALALLALALLLTSLWWTYRISQPSTTPEEMYRLQADELRAIAEQTAKQTPANPRQGIYKPPAGFVSPDPNTLSRR